MSESASSLRRKIASAGDLQSVVRTMKALAASNIGQYEKSVKALSDYYRTVELGLGVCFRTGPSIVKHEVTAETDGIGAIVFGSDQGLVGQFNDTIVDFAVNTLASLQGKAQVWAVGDRVHARLLDSGLPLMGSFNLPSSVQAIAGLVSQIQIQSESMEARGKYSRVYVFHNQPRAGALYEPVSQRLLPLDADWQASLIHIPWPSKIHPEILGDSAKTLKAFIREYLFISLFRACAESLASENSSRLAAMERAEKNIKELLETLHTTSHRLRQGRIDEELFDVISGFEALGGT
jgi:F-type H+-transporting ATPase subunit gamma